MKVYQKLIRTLLFSALGLILATVISVTPLLSNSVYAEPQENQPTNSEQTSQEKDKKKDKKDKKTSKKANSINQNSSNQNNSATNSENSTSPEETEETSCADQVGGMAWLVCPATGALAKAIDSIYGIIESFLIVKPIISDNSSPIYVVWEYTRNITNIAFIILLLIVVYSQITGYGLSNYGIKRTLPRIIIAAILVNLSFLICSLLVDISNIVGSSLHDMLVNVGESAIKNKSITLGNGASFSELFKALAAGGTFAGVAIVASGGIVAFFWAFITLICMAIVSIIIGLATVSLRQAVIAVLIMVSPLAFLAYLLPNTEKWYNKWSKIFSQMLIFFPAFSFLFGASRLVGWLFIASASNALGLILGVAVQVLPLFLAASLMKMSGTVLGKASSLFDHFGNQAKSGIKTFTDPKKQLAKQDHLAKNLEKPFRAWRVGSWRAANHQRNVNLDYLNRGKRKNIDDVSRDRLNALKLGKRLIGYKANGDPIYSTRVPKSNKYMRQEMKNRELNLKTQANELKTDNAFSSLGDYLQENNITDQYLANLSERQAKNYLDYRTQTTAKAINDRSDNNYYFSKVREAMEDYQNNENSQLYKNLIVAGAGASGYKNADLNQQSNAIATVVANAYDAYEAERSSAVRKYTSYFDTLNPKMLKEEYAKMRKVNNAEGIIASHNVLSAHGDYDVITKGMDEFMGQGKLLLGTDGCRSIAQNLMGMKNADPSLGRLGKFIFVETGAYANGSRKTQAVTMKQLLTGKIDDIIVDANGNQIHLTEVKEDGSDYQTKFRYDDLLNGTSWTGMDRTATDSLDYLTNKYLTDEESRMNVYSAILPQWTTDLGSFASGSEPIVSIMKQMTGLKYDKTNRVYKPNPDDHRPQETMNITKQYLRGLKPHLLANMKSDTFSAIFTKFTYELGSETAAENEFRRICQKNGNIEQLRHGDPSSLNLMVPKLRNILGL